MRDSKIDNSKMNLNKNERKVVNLESFLKYFEGKEFNYNNYFGNCRDNDKIVIFITLVNLIGKKSH